MKTAKLLLTIVISCTSAVGAAQSSGDAATKIKLPGIELTRSLNGATENLKVSADTLTITSAARRDNFNDPDGKLSNNTAPMLLTSLDNRQPFTLTSRVAPLLKEVYDAGALYIWVNEGLWLKMAMELDERRKSRMVSVRTTHTSDDNNHDVVIAKAVYMKISSDTKTVGFYYSTNQREWQLIRLFKNDYPDTIWVGFSAQSPLGEGTSAAFSEISLTHDAIKDFRLGK